MTLSQRPCRGDADVPRIRDFLHETFRLDGGRELCWQAYRFDYWRWHGILNMGDGTLEEGVFLWEDAGRLVAVLNTEAPGWAILQVHPRHRSLALEAAMLDVAEAELPRPRRTGGRPRLVVWADSGDDVRRALLAARGFVHEGVAEFQRRRPLSRPVPDVPVAAGYAVRAMRGPEDHRARAAASWRAFHPDDLPEAFPGAGWYANIERAPLYRPDLDLVAEAPDGAIAAFATVWFDPVTQTGAFEPVGTAPEHRRRGLGKAVIAEGLRRLKDLGAETAHVGSYGEPAHSLYASMGFTEYDVSEGWVREY
ncbi:MAG: GNAT family N-acetyltransferase [Candidatus Krumholzibacteriota bacterium]|nr:GNAT family N-acetyltransferase [Candidatus Krumholzibacteriota bacterium]